MELDKPRGRTSSRKISISPSVALANEADRQVEADLWRSRTEFYEAAAWLMIEMQALGADFVEGNGMGETAPPEEVVKSHSDLALNINYSGPVPTNDDESESDDE